jgi:ribosomal protein L7/L12
MHITIVLWICLLAIILFGIAGIRSLQKKESARIRSLWPPPGQAPTVGDVKRLARTGNKILAIKMYREIHPGVRLKEAKDAVEKMDLS